MYQVRTDLALEAREKFENDNVEVKGVTVKEENPGRNMKVTKVIIETENGAKIKIGRASCRERVSSPV